MEIVAWCPKCLLRAVVRADAGELACARCGDRRPVRLSESLRDRKVVDVCALCGCGHFYLEKDFNRAAGYAIVGVAAAGSAVAWAFNVYLAIGILAAAALLDLAVWSVARERTVCYKCEAIYRGAAPNPAHGRYELGLAGRFADDYEDERRRRQE